MDALNGFVKVNVDRRRRPGLFGVVDVGVGSGSGSPPRKTVYWDADDEGIVYWRRPNTNVHVNVGK